MPDAVTDTIDLAEIWRKRMGHPDGGVFTYLIESDRLAYRVPIGETWDYHQWTIPPGTLNRIRYEIENPPDEGEMMMAVKRAEDMLKRGSKAMLDAAYADMEQTRYFYLGYTRLEESMWMRFNRCCNAGRKMRIKGRALFIRAGKPTVSFRRAQPSTPTDVTPA